MSLMTVEPGVKPGFFVARFPVVPSINLTHSPKAGSYGESGGDLEFIPDSRSSLTRSQGQAPELSRFSRFSIPWNPPPGTGSVSWRAVGWNGSLLRREFSLLGRSITPAIWPIPQGRGNNREALPVNSGLSHIDSLATVIPAFQCPESSVSLRKSSAPQFLDSGESRSDGVAVLYAIALPVNFLLVDSADSVILCSPIDTKCQ